ncbi:MAG: RagB/SusD family nutrient uptake outer membrane protein [Bacteroidota bacterium]
MRKTSLYILVAASFLFSACSNFLSVEPQQSLSAEEVYSTTQDLETALVGAYNGLSGSDLMGCNLTMVPDIMSDNGTWRGSFTTFIDISNLDQTPLNGEVTELWREGYVAINDANILLSQIDGVEDADIAANGDRIRGEALFIRGAVYFEMVRYFGKPYSESSSSDLGIPLVLNATFTTFDTSDPASFPARATVEAIYDQAISDLTEASNLLPETNLLGRATKWGAIAYLAEIAFQQRDYVAASGFATQLIDGGFALTATPAEFFTNEGSSESIYELFHNSQDNPGVNGSLPTFHHVQGRGGDVIVSQDLINNGFFKIVPQSQLDELTGAGFTYVDQRLSTLTSDGGTFADSGGVNIEKYEDFVNNADNAPVHRLAEYILMQAECIVRNGGDKAEAVALLNQIRNRAIVGRDANGDAADISGIVSYEVADFADDQALIDAIVLERRVELCFEGNRLHDLNRLQLPVQGNPTGSDNLVWPVPQRELDNNSSLTQNPGY